MTFQGHLVLASLPVALLYKYNPALFSNPETGFMLAGYFLGSLLPDVDEPESYIGKKMLPISLFLKELGIQHRGITHTIWFVLFFMLIAYFLKSYFILGIAIGSLIHIIGDMLTKGGVAFFYPFNSFRFGLLPKALRFYTNSPTEYLVILLILITDFVFLSNKIQLF